VGESLLQRTSENASSKHFGEWSNKKKGRGRYTPALFPYSVRFQRRAKLAATKTSVHAS
jgi:hypothetical protein